MADETESKWRSRKFLLTSFISLVSTVALFTNKMSGAEAAGVLGACITAYNVGNAWAKR